MLWVLHLVDQVGPHRKISRLGLDVELFADQLIHALCLQHLRNLINGVDIPDRDHCFFTHIGEERDLGALICWNPSICTAQ